MELSDVVEKQLAKGGEPDSNVRPLCSPVGTRSLRLPGNWPTNAMTYTEHLPTMYSWRYWMVSPCVEMTLWTKSPIETTPTTFSPSTTGR